jgi:hypothetical protein
MKLQRIVINVDQKRRIVLHPEGGMDLEAFVEGPGWVLDNDAHVPEGDLWAVLYQTLGLVERAEHNAKEPQRARSQMSRKA